LRQALDVPRETATARWRRIAREARAESDRREAALGLEPMYAGEPRSFARLSAVADEPDPFLRRALEHVDRSTTVVDVGAGAGRYALALAATAHEVVAVDPSPDLVSTASLRAST
jgi:2-polyprenyl-3-methyl-5-hydroxy-6-metoxy-1,4-benzoquinol methylase